MNKKTIAIIAGIICIILVVCVVFLVKGEKLEEVTLSLQIDSIEKTVSATVGYPKNKEITVEQEAEDIKTIKNEKKKYSLQMYLNADTTYADDKEVAREEFGYDDVKYGEFTGYIIMGEYDVDGYILLQEISDQNRYIYLAYTLEPIESDDEEVNVEELYKLDEVQKVLKSIKYDAGNNTVEETKQKISQKEEEEENSNYGEFKDRSRSEGTSDKDGLIFIPAYDSPKPETYKAEQRNDNVGVDNYLWYTAEDRGFDASGIEVRVFPKKDDYESIEKYIEEKGDMYHWSKAIIGDKEYDVFTFGSESSTPSKYSKYYNGAFMVGNKVVEFSYNMYAEVPDQDLGDKFFKQIIDSIEYSKNY